MPTKFLLHTILLILAALGVFFWLSESALIPYTLQLVAILVLLYLGSHWLRAHRPSWFRKSSITIDVTILTSMILLLISETGAIESPFFFLIIFLLFSVAMLYEIEATLVLTGILVLYFLFLPSTNLTNLAHLSTIISLIMITPLAIFTGHQYENSLEEKKIREAISSELSQEETDTLLFLSLNLKKTLLSALDSLSITIPLTKAKEVRQNLETLYGDLKALYRTSKDLEQTLEKEDGSLPKI
jgi:hypothetical protein